MKRDSILSKDGPNFQSQSSIEEREMIVPPLFMCPISLDLFTDPVTLCTGQTYDRSSIGKWLSAGNVTCPITMQRLDDLSVVPNHTLRHLIDQWLQESQNQICSHNVIETNDFDYDHSNAELKHKLISHESTLEEKLEIVKKRLGLSNELPMNNCFLIQLDFFTPLVEQVFGHSINGLYSNEDIMFSEQALACALQLLPFSDSRPLNLLTEESLLENFISLFGAGSMKIKEYLCNLVAVISSSLETQDLCGKLGKSNMLIQGIIRLLTQNPEANEAGIKAVSALATLESNREALVRNAALEGLIECIMHAERHEKNAAAIAIATIERLLTTENAKQIVVDHPSGIRAIVRMAFRVSDHQGSESAVNSLLALCGESHRAREEAMCAGVLTQLLLLLQSQCNGRTKSKARMLLKLLKSMWADGRRGEPAARVVSGSRVNRYNS